MPLTTQQIGDLQKSIIGYAFPPVYFDFTNNMEIHAGSIAEVEARIRTLLTSSNTQEIEHGLANVIYWGNANAGYQMHRVMEFRKHITQSQLQEFQALVSGGKIPTLINILKLKMPQFSGISFVSKIIAFLDPVNYCVLDLLLSRLNGINHSKALSTLKFTTQIGVTSSNSLVYYSWCKECIAISHRYYGGAYRAIDIERGFFNLIQGGNLSLAQKIYSAA
ncbi:hypothetical protein [Deefgea rivuli]|uniref:hypothetical protein n=1 Tax=Deefgea rivuli TaxID=400948 RepID=UPI00048679D8|nr:hypothetical protein [Deefgea rivuli]